jgi:hypothetical protein
MISDELIRKLYLSGQKTLASHSLSDAPLNSQFYRGMGSHFWEGQASGSCERHMEIFTRFNAIPRYCFDCYKVYIEPRNVIELLKLMVVFHVYNFPDKNTRKCIVELREHVYGAYKGFVYCREHDAGRKMFQLIRALVSREISPGVPVTLKRGCTEYAQAYPEYSPADAEGKFVMEYNEDWQKFEDLVDKQRRPIPETQIIRTFDQDSWTLEDARIMYGWLCYAAMIGDSSYLKISGTPLPTKANISRPEPFIPMEDD